MSDNTLADALGEMQQTLRDACAQAQREALLEAAADVEKLYHIGVSPSRDLTRADLDWHESDANRDLLRAVRRTTPGRENLLLIRDWLELRAGGRPE